MSDQPSGDTYILSPQARWRPPLSILKPEIDITVPWLVAGIEWTADANRVRVVHALPLGVAGEAPGRRTPKVGPPATIKREARCRGSGA